MARTASSSSGTQKPMSSKEKAAVASRGIDAASSLATSLISARGARKMEAERRKTEKATAKSRRKIEASKARIAEMEAKREEAAAAARQAEADAAAQAQKTKWIVGGVVGVGVLALLGLGLYVFKPKGTPPVMGYAQPPAPLPPPPASTPAPALPLAPQLQIPAVRP